jgi:hypothetical protein
LKKLVEEHGDNNWKIISQQLGLTAEQCRGHWKSVLNPDINHEPFTKEEDICILQV